MNKSILTMIVSVVLCMTISGKEATPLSENSYAQTTGLLKSYNAGSVEVNILPGGGGSPSFSSIPVQIEMNNPDTVRGIQFDIIDSANYLKLESVLGIGRTAGFHFVGKEVDGKSRILGVSLEGQDIEPGVGAVAEIVFSISSGAPVGSIPITISGLIVADKNALLMESQGSGGVFNVTLASKEEPTIPSGFKLSQNYPNPFNPMTNIAFEVSEKADAQIQIFNVRGQKVRDLISGNFQPGVYEVKWDGLNNDGFHLAAGIYIYSLTSTHAQVSLSRKLVILK